jgi:hypothetical protein
MLFFFLETRGNRNGIKLCIGYYEGPVDLVPFVYVRCPIAMELG